MANNMEDRKSVWSEEQLELAKMFRKTCGIASRSIWEAAEHAAAARLTFPKRAVNGEKSFSRYAIEQLERDPSTVSEWLLAISYCKKYEPQRLLDGKSKLPPISMVAKLVAIRPERRDEFHQKLFGPIGGTGMTASEFRRELESLKHPDLNDDGTPKEPNESKKSPTGGESRKPGTATTPSGHGSNQESTQDAGGSSIPEKAPNIEKTGQQTIPNADRTILIGGWSNSTELSEVILGILIANSTTIATGWTSIMIPPQGGVAGDGTNVFEAQKGGKNENYKIAA